MSEFDAIKRQVARTEEVLNARFDALAFAQSALFAWCTDLERDLEAAIRLLSEARRISKHQAWELIAAEGKRAGAEGKVAE